MTVGQVTHRRMLDNTRLAPSSAPHSQGEDSQPQYTSRFHPEDKKKTSETLVMSSQVHTDNLPSRGQNVGKANRCE